MQSAFFIWHSKLALYSIKPYFLAMKNIPIHKVVKCENQRQLLLETGYCIGGNIGVENVKRLRELYAALHNFGGNEGGGMFYSLYSDDLAYRQKVHNEIYEILKPVYDNLLVDYKTVINSFIVKKQGKGSDFTLHQDSTGLDETVYSPLSLWTPLQDTDLNNGTLCVIPKSHRMFHFLRGISFAAPFTAYQEVLFRYLQPINLKAGDILMFDNRLVHYSHTNESTQERIVVMSGIFPQEAEIWSVYKDESIANSAYEIYSQTDDFLITNTAFYKNCTERPYRGELIKTIETPLEAVTVYDFMSMAAANGVQATNVPVLMQPLHEMNIISEPV